ncbi:4562_t:CDS:2 [Cetraspora pellucida]|uniref:4562_t:CDS:1 n=1 Tax=Cetraspora pellucida TaxID=1433469 RepID=A0ACA9JYM3_9GLOM|nr:4562_t:CDS:2 [Cetraspora pellucida]
MRYTAKRQTVFIEHSEDDFDITGYFEESFHFTEDINDITKDIEVISLKEGDSFDNFDEAELYIHRFAEYRGFKIRLEHVKMLDTAENVKEIRKRTILCKHSGMFKQKNVEKQSNSSRIMCLWHVNLSRPLKGNLSFRVIVTTLDDTHNHDLSPEAIQFEKNKQFTDEMRKEIEFLVTKCRLGATMVRRILKEKFPFHPIFAKDLYTEIQRCHPSYGVMKNDASRFYEQLLSKQREDSCWFVEVMWEEETNTLINLFWMSPEQIILWYFILVITI